MRIKHKLQQSFAIIFIFTLIFAMFPGTVGAETNNDDSDQVKTQSKVELDEYPEDNDNHESNQSNVHSSHEEKKSDQSDKGSKEDNSKDHEPSNEDYSEHENDRDENKETVEPEQDTNINHVNYDEIIETSVEKAINYTLDMGVVSEWEAIAIARAGYEVPNEYKDIFYNTVDSQVVNPIRLKITDIERLAMAAQVINVDPLDINGLNLIEKIYNSEDNVNGSDIMTFQGINGPIFAIIALDSGGFSIPEDARWTKEKLINYLLNEQNENGSWSLFGPDPSYDITAMALIALGNHKDDDQVKEAINKAVSFLSESQNDKGGFYDPWNGGISLETAAQVMIGLTMVDVDPLGEKFTKKDRNLLDHILSFIADDGGFKHLPDSNESNNMSTEQGIQALVAYQLYINDEGGLYHFIENDEEIEEDLDSEDEEIEEDLDSEDKPEEDEETEEDLDSKDEETEIADDSESESKPTEEGDKESEKEEKEEKEPETDSELEDDSKTDEDETKIEDDLVLSDERTNGDENQIKSNFESEDTADKEQTGEKLPKTATNTYTFIFVGALLLLLSSLVFVIRKLKINR